MVKEKVLLEFAAVESEHFSMNQAAMASCAEATRQATCYLDVVAGLGVDLDEFAAPVPMMIGAEGGGAPETFRGPTPFSHEAPEHRGHVVSRSMLVPAEMPASAMAAARERSGVKVWPNSELVLYGEGLLDEAPKAASIDCCPFRPAVTIEVLHDLLGVDEIWNDGFRGQEIIVGILDEGVDGSTYPVIGGFARPGVFKQPGSAAVTSHGSMCAADVLVAAPECRLYDYPFLSGPRSGGAIHMFQAVLNQRRIDGTPHITSNSYGFTHVPDRAVEPDHEVHDVNHPLHRKVREVAAAGVTCFFAAGNCGQHCPSDKCSASGVGPGRSIHASNSLEEVITVAAVNSLGERIGYSSQGPGLFDARKPDIASYSHFHGNFGPRRPGGTGFDGGTSAATPLAAGVAALLISALGPIAPDRMKQVLMSSATKVAGMTGWSADFGHGVIDAAAAYRQLRGPGGLVG